MIPAWRLLQAKKQKNSTSRYRHLLECCELLGIGNITPFLDRMLVPVSYTHLDVYKRQPIYYSTFRVWL